MASTVAYSTAAQVKSLLPRAYSTTDLPDSTDTTFTSLATHIVKSSREVDSALAPHFCTFNATDHATYATPQYIQDITTNLAAARCFKQLSIGDRNTSYGARAKSHMEDAQAMIDALISVDPLGSSARFYLIANENMATETLVFGAGGQYDLDSREAFIQVQSNLTSVDIATVLADSVKVTATGLTLYARGRDFIIRFDPRHQRWVFTDLTGALYVLGTAKTISYDWTWRRHSEVQQESASSEMYIGGWQ